MKKLEEIQKAAEAEQWSARADAVRKLSAYLADCQDDAEFEQARQIFLKLAGDPKWEVRLVVAETAPNLTVGIFNAVIARLLDDQNRYVKGAAQRSRRQRDQVYRSEGDDAVSPTLQRTLSRLDNLLAGNEEARRLAREAAQQAQMQSLAEFAHELKNLLHPLTSAVSRLESELSPNQRSKHKRTLESIFSQGRKLAEFAGNMRFVAEGKELNFDNVSCRHVINQVLQTVREKAQDHRVTLRTPQVAEITIKVVNERLVRALTNIVLNAIEASLPGGVVEIRAEQLTGSNEMEFQIIDDGKGIEKEDQEAIFEPLKSGKREGGHLGMGLFIASEVINLEHQGSIAVESGEGKGTTFKIRVPMQGSAGCRRY